MKTLISLFLVIIFAISTTYSEEYIEIDEYFKVDRNDFRVKLDVDAGKVKIVKGEKRNECRVLLKYEEGKCQPDVRYNEKQNELRIKLDLDGIHWGSDEERNNIDLDVVVELPTRAEIDFDGRIKAGEVDIFIGDLYIQDFELSIWAGETHIEFEKPNKMEMETFEVNAKIGETHIYGLGNANFGEGDINGGIGEMLVDFHGESPQKSMATIDLDIGETTIIVPEDIGVKLRVSKFLFLSEVNYPNWFDKQGKYYYSENYKESDHSLYLSISQGIGELDIKVE
jgi:hypothetical protein